ncbi:hypothetical protein, partial [Candidatus Cardinium sp. cBcalN2]
MVSSEEVIKYFGENLDINARASDGSTFFMHLTQEDGALSADRTTKLIPPENKKVWDWFLEKADLNAKNNDGETALMLAA